MRGSFPSAALHAYRALIGRSATNLKAEISAVFFGRKRLVDQPHGAVHCSSPRFGGAGFNGPFVQLDRPLPCAALDTLDNGVLLASILHPTSPTKSPVRKIAFPERGEVEVESPSNRKRKGSYHRADEEQSRDLMICGNVPGQPGLTGDMSVT
jgi:hypothetical protein